MLEYNKYKMLRFLGDEQLILYKNENCKIVKFFHRKRKLCVNLKSVNSHNEYKNILIKDLDFNDFIIENNSYKKIITNADVVLTKNEFNLLYNDGKDADFSEYFKEKEFKYRKNFIWSVLKFGNKFIMVNGIYKNAVGLEIYSKYSYNENVNIIVDYEKTMNDTMFYYMIKNENIKEDKVLDFLTFNSKYFYINQNFITLEDAKEFIKKNIGVPENRDDLILPFIWSYYIDKYGVKTCVNGLFKFEKSAFFNVTQFPWSKFKKGRKLSFDRPKTMPEIKCIFKEEDE